MTRSPNSPWAGSHVRNTPRQVGFFRRAGHNTFSRKALTQNLDLCLAETKARNGLGLVEGLKWVFDFSEWKRKYNRKGQLR